MTKEEAIKILKELQDNLFDVDVSFSLHYDHSLDEIINILHNQPEWIPCSERMPELPDYNYTSRLVIADTGCGKSTVLFYERALIRGKKVTRWKYIFDRIFDGEVIAWMPLPEPYKGGENE